jgi:hypothetical protein
MTSYAGLKHFKQGVSTISQWTGNEYKEMERAFVGVVAGAMDAKAVQAARALMDFAMYAQYPIHTSETLAAMTQALKTFHKLRSSFSTIRDHFNIPKLHAISHYVDLIKTHGSTIGFNTELPECLHIDYAKRAYQHSNKKLYTRQMTRWLTRQEAVRQQDSYLDWLGISRQKQQRARSRHTKITIPDYPFMLSQYRRRFEVIKTPSYPNTSVSTLIKDYGASDFIPRLNDFFMKNLAPRSFQAATMFDTFDLYQQCQTTLESINDSIQPLKNTICASPSISAQYTSKGIQEAIPPHFDTALITTDGTVPHTTESIAHHSMFSIYFSSYTDLY